MRRVLVLLALVAAPAAQAGAPATIAVGGDGDRAAARYFAYVNAHGGVNGRKIVYGQAVETSLVAFTELFGVFGPSYRLQGAVLARQLAKTTPRAKLAVLYQDDEDGAALVAGLRRGLGPRVTQVVDAVRYDPAATDVGAEVAQLRATRAQALFAFGPLAARAQAAAARLGWRPQVYLASGSPARTVGAVSVTAFKDPADPRWRGDPGVGLARRVLPDARASDVASMAAAFTLVDVLRRAGRAPTRAKVMAAVASLHEANNPFVIPGITVPIRQVALERWTGTHWAVFTGPLAIP
jgi:branched-chain amino acid transport system substrate-binding protein